VVPPLAGRRLDAAGTLPVSFARHWSASPGAAALTDAADGRVVTGGELEAASRHVAGELLARGLRPGDRVLCSPGDPLPFAVTVVAALRAGLVLVPANPELTAPELRHVIEETGPAACAADDSSFRSLVAQIDDAVPMLEPGAAFGRWSPSRTDGFPAGATREGASTGERDLDASAPSDPAMVLFTSGTTGKPKGAVHTHASLLANAESLRVAWRWTPEDRLVHTLPMFHAHGLCVGLLGTLNAGASAVLLPRFGVAELLEACVRYDATLWFGVPTMYHRIHASGRVGELARLRLAVSGSAALPAALHTAIAEATGVAILERYGTTETLMSLSNPYAGERRAGTVGLPLPGVEIRLLRSGELLVRGPAVFAGYLGRPEASKEAFDGDWYRTGDVASVGDDGYVRILGRTKELVITGGFNVYPAEVETVLAEHPSVAEVAVTGTPSDEWGEIVTAWIVPAASSEGLTSEITAFAAARLAPYKRPRLVHIVESLPRNALGKIVRHQLDADK
jgi:malonyl-CoA/methylmalonyl-CoA synthetase